MHAYIYIHYTYTHKHHSDMSCGSAYSFTGPFVKEAEKVLQTEKNAHSLSRPHSQPSNRAEEDK